MNPSLFATGKTWGEYMNSIAKNRDRFEDVYERFMLSEQDLNVLRAAGPLRIVAIAEDWCPDVYHTLGMIARAAEAAPQSEMRIFERDSRPEIMENYLTHGKKRIPVCAFFTPDFRELCRWAGRSREADVWVNDFRKNRPYDQIPAEEMAAFRAQFDENYEKTFRRQNLEEMLGLLRRATAGEGV